MGTLARPTSAMRALFWQFFPSFVACCPRRTSSVLVPALRPWSETREIEAVPISRKLFKRWNPRTAVTAWLRRVFVGLPSELWRGLDAFKTLKGADVLIIPGTGLLTDAYGLTSWGPYNLFKWSSIAKVCRCKILFVSVGAGPVYSTLGKYFVKSALSLADFRSYRDNASLEYLKRIGFETNSDRIYPDLVFSLPRLCYRVGGNRKGKTIYCWPRFDGVRWEV